MGRKEITTKEDLMKVIELFENTGITYWLDGGWGVDILAGKQTRIHRDIDINFDAQHTEKLLNVLLNLGYKIDTDWKPVRIELYSDELGYLETLFHDLCKHGKWHKIQNGDRAGKSRIGLPPIIAY